MRHGLVDAQGKVVNVVNVVDDWEPPSGLKLVAGDDADIGDTWDGKVFVKPPRAPQPVVELPPTDVERLLDALVAEGVVPATKRKAVVDRLTGKVK